MWQLIETAPKDGTWILTYTPPGIGMNNYIFRNVKEMRFSQDKFKTLSSRVNQPTHWMPLPPPPVKGD